MDGLSILLGIFIGMIVMWLVERCRIKAEKLLELNKSNMEILLNPLKERIEEFKKDVENVQMLEIRDIASIKAQIGCLLELNRKISNDVNKSASVSKD